MFSLFRERFGIPGVVAVIALVFALAGSAYAAKKYVITSTNQIKPSVLKSLKGSPGAPGATGAQGPKGDTGAAGTNGKDGTNGTNGKDGTNGKSVVLGTINPGDLGCGSGGASVEVEGSGSKKAVCNGETGFTETLPSEATETGSWGAGLPEGPLGSRKLYAPVSLNIPLSAAPEAVFVPDGGSVAGKCPGVLNGVPTAEPGVLCVYSSGIKSGNVELGSAAFLNSATPALSASQVGAVLLIPCEGEAPCFATGSWAATAP